MSSIHLCHPTDCNLLRRCIGTSSDKEQLGGVPDNESGFHTQGWVMTQKKPVLRRGVYVANNMCMPFCMNKCAVPS